MRRDMTHSVGFTYLYIRAYTYNGMFIVITLHLNKQLPILSYKNHIPIFVYLATYLYSCSFTSSISHMTKCISACHLLRHSYSIKYIKHKCEHAKISSHDHILRMVMTLKFITGESSKHMI